MVAALKDDQDPIADRKTGRLWSGLESRIGGNQSRPETACDNVARKGEFFEAIVDHMTGAIVKVEPITEGEDLAHANRKRPQWTGQWSSWQSSYPVSAPD